MHLSDLQLLSLRDSQANKLENEFSVHLSDCIECQKRLNHIHLLRKSLQQTAQSELPDSLQLMPDKLIEELDVLHQKRESESQLSFWQKTSFALAASLVVVFAGMSYINYQYVSKIEGLTKNNQDKADNDLVRGISDQPLSVMINLNQKMQHKIESQSRPVDLVRVESKYLERKLNAIDDALQQAYLIDLSEREKLKLWQERLGILKALEAQSTQSKRQKTIRI